MVLLSLRGTRGTAQENFQFLPIAFPLFFFFSSVLSSTPVSNFLYLLPFFSLAFASELLMSCMNALHTKLPEKYLVLNQGGGG